VKHNSYHNKDELKVRVNPKGDEETVYDDDEEVLNDDVMKAMMPEMQNYQRAMTSPQHVVSASDILRVNDDTLTNMTSSERY
jgi:3-phenylpropionate/cinnamic acid dioxygenase small subunit